MVSGVTAATFNEAEQKKVTDALSVAADIAADQTSITGVTEVTDGTRRRLAVTSVKAGVKQIGFNSPESATKAQNELSAKCGAECGTIDTTSFSVASYLVAPNEPAGQTTDYDETATIIGITVGVVAGFSVALLVAWLLYKRTKGSGPFAAKGTPAATQVTVADGLGYKAAADGELDSHI